ncbi:MAG: SDR family oxidoreductase [Sandaracinus sp.]|nr:SDR family oxidoreductase [Sandaracinus sp.]MCB9620267.1 SDR family oxidoreductase [Sandaracinus sp.]MCB9623767.1 SDR family oxidoreductase [Sandaracinus sp.]
MTATSNKVVLVTGANSGIGKETAAALAKEGAHVVLAIRNRAKGEAAADEIESRTGVRPELLTLDLASFGSIREAAATFLAHHDKLHVLVNNAGLVLDSRTTTVEGFETTFGVNHLGHFLFTRLLLGALKKAAKEDREARIVNVSSDAHRWARRGLDWDDLQSEKKYASFDVYAKSKLANIYFTRALARRLEATGVTVNALHPGVVATEFASSDDVGFFTSFGFKLVRPFLKTSAQGAATSIFLASSPEVRGVNGKYFADAKLKHPMRLAQDDALAERLWTISEAMVASVETSAAA